MVNEDMRERINRFLINETDFIKDAYKTFGADDFITKPFKTEVFLKKIEHLIS